MSRVIKVIVFSLAATQLIMAAVLLLTPIFSYRYVNITSGSMEPIYAAGDATLVNTDKKEVIAGKPVTLMEANGNLLTHRVTKVNGESFFTKGDANRTADPLPHSNTSVFGTPTAAIPFGGYIGLFLASPLGKLLTLAPILVYFLIGQLKQISSKEGVPA